LAAYLILELDIDKPELMIEYRERSGAILAAHGGRYLVRGGEYQTLEGGWAPPRVAVVEFPSYEAALGFYNSDAYKPLLGQRLAAGAYKAIVVKGVDE
jgi:uncharacterized protein (DUF1330 family)